MVQEPPWTQEEFETLVGNVDLSDEQVADLLPRRSVDAVKIVRAGIHAYHRGMNISMLSRIMQDRLADTGRPVPCRRCEEIEAQD